MNIGECYDLHSIIKELELALQIEDGDLRETDMDKLMANIKKKIAIQYNVDLTGFKINSPEIELSQRREDAALFIENIARIHAKLCGYAQVKRYLYTNEISMEDINYLGLTRDSFKKNIIAMEREYFQPRVSSFIEVLKQRLPNISNSWEKRLLVLAVVTIELGFTEVAASIAEIIHRSLKELTE